MFRRAALAVTFLTAFSARVSADLAPEPYEPASPYFWGAVIAVAAVSGFFLYRRRGK